MPEKDNIEYIRSENRNNDFGGYCLFANEYFENQHQALIFINSSMRGPFVPNFVDTYWVDFFLRALKNDVQLVGASANVPRQIIRDQIQDDHSSEIHLPHVQTTAYALSGTAMRSLKESGFYSQKDSLSKDDVVAQYEIGLSRYILEKGWNIASLLPANDTVAVSQKSDFFPNFSAKNGDVLFSRAFYGRSLSPTDALFIKTNRNMITSEDLASYTFTTLCSHQDRLDQFPEAQQLLKESYLKAKSHYAPSKISVFMSNLNWLIRGKPSKYVP